MLKKNPRLIRHVPAIFLAIFLLFVLSGCATKPLDLSLVPTQEMVITKSQSMVPVTVGVMPFIDERPMRHGSDNAKWKGLIPGMLWIEISSDIPETYTAFSHYEAKPLDRASSQATVEIIKRAGLFSQVVDLQKQPGIPTDYHLNGVVYQTMVNETGYYYGSCIYAWLVRVLGLPYVSFQVEYHLGLSLTEVSSGKMVWQTEIKGTREDKFYSVYSISRGREGKHIIAWNIADIFAQEFNRHVDGIADELKKK